jgi:hypothetical protein
MNLASTFVVLQPDQSATPVEVTPTLERARPVLDGAAAPVELRDAGAFKTSVPTTMLFVTPGAGTEHKPVG